MTVLKVSGLCKSYSGFELKNVALSLEKGRIMGFIGRNGAGKTTTMKSLVNFIHPDAGRIEFFGLNFAVHEREIKERIGFVSGEAEFYPHSKLRAITDVSRAFYRNWNEKSYRENLKRFSLDENKTPAQLSAGMKVKYALTLALSHHAELLLLDEPTSGLDRAMICWMNSSISRVTKKFRSCFRRILHLIWINAQTTFLICEQDALRAAGCWRTL